MTCTSSVCLFWISLGPQRRDFRYITQLIFRHLFLYIFFYLYPILRIIFFSQSNVIMTWGGWLDDLSGLEKFQYETYEMDHDGSMLLEKTMVKNPTDILLTSTQVGTDFDLLLSNTA